MSWTQRIKHPSEMYQKGEEVEAVVLNIDTQDGEKPKISLGVKQLIADPWDRIPYDYPVGKVIDGKILKVLDFGAFVELEKGVEGLVHVSEIADERVEDPREKLKPGQDVKVQIITVDPIERKIGLSIKGATRASELADAQGYAGGTTSGATLGDVMRAKLSGGGEDKKKKAKGKKQRPAADDGDWDAD
jgi:small subunit ribosomal protein S1